MSGEKEISMAHAFSSSPSIEIAISSSATPTAMEDNRLAILTHVIILLLVMLAFFVLMAFLTRYLTRHGMQDLSMHDILVHLRLARRAAAVEERTHSHSQTQTPTQTYTQILESLPTLVFSSTESLALSLNAEDQQSECVICLDQFGDGETLHLLPHCAHLFHVHCIKMWLLAHTTCPLCRHSLLSAAINTNTESANTNINMDMVNQLQASSLALEEPLDQPLPTQMQHLNVDISPQSRNLEFEEGD